MINNILKKILMMLVMISLTLNLRRMLTTKVMKKVLTKKNNEPLINLKLDASNEGNCNFIIKENSCLELNY